MLDIIQNTGDIIAFFLLFGFTIFVHELGHFAVAIWCGMVVDTFSIGFGPALWKKKIRGINFKLGWIPFGGYVALPQLDPAGMSSIQGSNEEDKTDSEETSKDDDDNAEVAYPPIAPWKKILVSFAGATGNVIFAIVLAWVIFLSPGTSSNEEASKALIGFVDTNSVAYVAGIRAGDEIVAVNGEVIHSWNDYAVLCLLGTGKTNVVELTLKHGAIKRDISIETVEVDLGLRLVAGIARAASCQVTAVIEGMRAEAAGILPGDLVRSCDGEKISGRQHFINLVESKAGQKIALQIERGDELLNIVVEPVFVPEEGRAMIGVGLADVDENAPPAWMAHKDPWLQIKGDASGIIRILRALVTPKESKQAASALGGPVAILTHLWVAIQVSLLNGIGFLRFLNINLAILNLLPIPVLDGGHIVFSLWEWITRRRAHPKLVNALVNIFAALLLLAFAILTFRDVVKLPKMLRLLGIIKDDAPQEEVQPALSEPDMEPDPGGE